MRIRTIKPEFWGSEDITPLSRDARLVFIGLWNYVDDPGVGRDSVPLIVSALFPADEPQEARIVVTRAREELLTQGLITTFEVDGRSYLHVTGWTKHQKISRPVGSKLPRFPGVDRAVSPSTCEEHAIADESHVNDVTGAREQGSKGARERGSAETTAPRAKARTALDPEWTPDDGLTAWAKENAPAVNILRAKERFVNYYLGVGGVQALKADWSRTWKNWLIRDQEQAERNGWQKPASDRMSWK